MSGALKELDFFFFSLLLYLLYHSKGCYIICNSCMLHGTDAKPCSLMGHLALNLNNKLFSNKIFQNPPLRVQNF